MWCSVAVGNAIEEVRAVAYYVTDDNDHDGIAKYLSEHEEKEKEEYKHFGMI